MKRTLFLLLISYAANVNAQEVKLKMKEIDSLVTAINHTASYYTRHDSTVQDYPSLKLYMKTYTTTVMNSKNLKKFVNTVRTKTEEKGTQKTLITSNAFYYDDGQLIKVEEYAADSSHEQRFEWYYTDSKPLYHTATPAPDTPGKLAKMDERAISLLTIAQGIKTQEESRIPKM